MSEKAEIKIQSITRLYILLLLKSERVITGYKILKLLEKDLGIIASPTTVYDFIKDLKSNGFIIDIEKPHSKRSTGFKLTTSGIKFVNNIFYRFDNLIEVFIQSKLEICANCGVKLYNDFYMETVNGKEMKFCCTHCAKAYIDNLQDN
ncbi:MAG: hypothetical protein ACFFEY_08230 [Candidatus Thorarchaeota archaeon]